MKLTQSYQRLPEQLYHRCAPSPVSAPHFLAVNKLLGEQLGLNQEWMLSSEGLDFFSGNAKSTDYASVATVYAGFQFGQYNPQLGDGRALLLGETEDSDGQIQEIQLKGAGPTPYSRGGDGRSALGPVIREYLVSEAMHALGVPTTRALMALRTGDTVIRDRLQPGGILVRVAPSHLRFGSFQFAAARQDEEALNALMALAFARHYPQVAAELQTPQHLLKLVTERTAQLVAKWMSIGFIHGVMNTDNMSIGGLTLDYGPCAFQDTFAWQQVFSSIDTGGRYRYAQQPNIALWNLARLAEALLPIWPGTDDHKVAEAEAILHTFELMFEKHRNSLFAAKLGLSSNETVYEKTIEPFLNFLEEQSLDFTLSFALIESLSKLDQDRSRLIRAALPRHEKLESFWRNSSYEQGQWRNDLSNPIVIPRNHQIEAAIKGAEQGHDEEVLRLFTLYTSQPSLNTIKAEDIRGPEPGEWLGRTFCGT
jgi:uncharacterized protein YdiU (UPF0061 family)